MSAFPKRKHVGSVRRLPARILRTPDAMGADDRGKRKVMTYMIQRYTTGQCTKFLYIGVLVLITNFVLVSSLVFLVFLPRDGFQMPVQAKESPAVGVIVNATGIDNPAKARLPETSE